MRIGHLGLRGRRRCRIQVVEHGARLLELARQLLHRVAPLLLRAHRPLGDGHGARHRIGVRIRQRKRQLAHAERLRHLLGTAGEHGVRATLRRSAHFYIARADALGEARAQRLEHRLLRREARGVMDGRLRGGIAIAALLGAEHLARERGRPLEDLAHTLDLHDVHAQAHGPLDGAERGFHLRRCAVLPALARYFRVLDHKRPPCKASGRPNGARTNVALIVREPTPPSRFSPDCAADRHRSHGPRRWRARAAAAARWP